MGDSIGLYTYGGRDALVLVAGYGVTGVGACSQQGSTPRTHTTFVT